MRKRYLPAAIIATAFLALGLLAWRLYNPPALYRIAILPSHALAESLNDHGQVVGLVHENGGTRPFLWDRIHGVQDLGLIGGCRGGLRINNSGQIAGTTPTDANCSEAFLWEPGKGRTMLGTLGGKRSSVDAMNNRGQIVGMSCTADGNPRPFLWDNETGMKELPRPAGTQCIPKSIDDAGQILIMSIKQTPSLSYDYSWSILGSSGSKPVAPLPPDTWLCSLNDNSYMAGITESQGPKPYLFFLDGQGKLRRLCPIGVHGHATRLNNKNQIAYTRFADNRLENLRDRLSARFFRPRLPSLATVSYVVDPVKGRIPLNRYLVGMKRFHVVDLNNDGCIIGTAEIEDGTTRSVLLEPIPERWGK